MLSLLFIFLFFFCTHDALRRPRTRGPKIPATTPAMDPAMTPATTPATIPFNFTYYDPIFGALTAPQDIQDFVASVFAKAALDRCNSSGSACRKVFSRYGKVCAGNHDLTAHTTFDSICDMYDTNCWDGTYSTFTTAGNSNVVWMPIGPSGYLDFKVATAHTTGFILAPTRSLDASPRWSFQYGTLCKIPRPSEGLFKFKTTTNSCIEVNELGLAGLAHGDRGARPPEWNFPEFWNFDMHPSLGPEKDLRDKKARQFRLQWNETSRFVGISYLWNETTPKHPGYFGSAVVSWGFAAQYFGIWGGTPAEPTWWEISGLPRGYMLAYRGKCQADLPTIPPDQSLRLGQDIDVKMYNFAERNEFGYNYSREAKNNSGTFYMADEELYDTNLYS